MKTYDVISPLRHDGKLYEPGATVDLDDKAAGPLLAEGVIKLAAKAAKK